MSQNMYLAPGVEMVMLMMSLAMVMSAVGSLTYTNSLPQLVAFYVVPIFVVYNPLQCNHVSHL